jgi:starch synthase
MRIIHVASEATPFIKTGGLADVLGELPKQQARNSKNQVYVILPYYGNIPSEYKQAMSFIKYFDVYMGNGKQYVGIFTLELNKVNYIFIDNQKYFYRDNVYGYNDDGERFAFFSIAALETMSHLILRPDVVHCHDWQTGFVSVMYHEHYKYFQYYENFRFVMTIHNLAYLGNYPRNILDLFLLNHDIFNSGKVRFRNGVSFLKGGLEYSDIITTVSDNYKKEVATPEGGCGLEYFFQYRYQDFYGVLNGIDYNYNNPKTNKNIVKNYNVNSLELRNVNKKSLQKEFGLPISDVPVFSVVTRFTWQKGIELIIEIAHDLLKNDVQLIILGSGDNYYENSIQMLREQYPTKIGTYIGYNSSLSDRIYAGSDFFLMPSLFEPCGISQMLAMHYGSIPIVRETGGLVDTVIPYNEYTGIGTGFRFQNNAVDFLHVIKYALQIYNDKERFTKIIEQAMNYDFSWANSVDEYQKLYRMICKRK